MTDSTNRTGGNGEDRIRADRDRVRSDRLGSDEGEPDGTYTDEEYEDGTSTVEHGEEHSRGGDYTDTDFTEDEVDRAKRHD